MSFTDKLVERRREAHPDKPCECWDCIRALGLTPPMDKRDGHRSQFPKPWHSMRGFGIDIPGIVSHVQLIRGQSEDRDNAKAEVAEIREVEDKYEGRRQ